MNIESIPVSRFADKFFVDADGILRRIRAYGSRPAGQPIGSNHSEGYLFFKAFGGNHKVHRVVYAIHYGEWPKGYIDHIDGNRKNNRVENLRVVSHSMNMQNRRSAHRNNASGFLGVTPTKWGFAAVIRKNKKTIWLGTFKTPGEAHTAYVAAKRELHDGNTL